jgi:hypothetical protein
MQSYTNNEGHIARNKYNTPPQKKSKAIPETGRGGLWSCEMSRIPRCLDSRLTHGGQAVNLTRRPRFTPINIPVLIPVTGS